MVTGAKKSERANLEKIATQLASVKILARAEDEQLTLTATATFTTRSFIAGKYQVAVGINQALLHLDHPSFDRENAYQATLAKETWSQSWQNLKASQVSGNLKANIGVNILKALRLTAEGQAGKDSRVSAEQKASAPYPIVSAMPTGWRIGTELGDPRAPEGALPGGLEHCLNGEYLSGRQEECGDGYRDNNGAFALCVLKVASGNDPRITATLIGVSGSLRVAVTLADPAESTQPVLQSQSESRESEESLRKAFVEICLRRAEEAHKDGVKTNAMLTGEFYLNHYEIHSPKLPQKAPSEIQTKTKGHSG